jgi:hypothetical protein
METQKPAEQPKKKGGRPLGYSPTKTSKPEVSLSIEGEYVIIKLPKKDLSRKLLADLI